MQKSLKIVFIIQFLCPGIFSLFFYILLPLSTFIFPILTNSFTSKFSANYISKSVRIWKSRLRKKGMLVSKGLVFQALVKKVFWGRVLQILPIMYCEGMSWHEVGPALIYFFLPWSLWKVPLLWSKILLKSWKLSSVAPCSSFRSAAASGGMLGV